MPNFHDDSPIENQAEDRLGYKALANSIAECVLGIQKIKGGVIAVRGPWGSGKSSVINMVTSELKNRQYCPIIITFNSWCYRFEDEVVAGFFQELYSGLKPEAEKLDIKLDDIAILGTRIMGATKLLTTGIKLAVPGSDALLTFSQDILKNAIAQDQTLGSLQNKVSNTIRKLERRILFVIDDVDRLSPDEAIAVFRIIKSVGRLDNVIYLLSYDRVATENAIEKVYPSEGSRYLEKIVQAGFDLPDPSRSKLIEILMSRLHRAVDSDSIYTSKRIVEIIYNVVAQHIKTPRNAHQLANVVSVTYPSVKDNVHIGDFIAVETLRIFRPEFYKDIYTYKNMLVHSRGEAEDNEARIKRVNDTFINIKNESEKYIFQGILRWLFPVVDGSLSRKFLLSKEEDWKREKRVCSAPHFDTYFRFDVSDDTISNAELVEFCNNAGNEDYVSCRFRGSAEESYNEHKIAYLLDEIIYDVNKISVDDIVPFLITLYSIAGEIYVNRYPDDLDYLPINNRDRVIELTKKVLQDSSLELNAAEVISAICRVSPLELLVQFCGWICRERGIKNRNMKLHLDHNEYIGYDDIARLKQVTLDRINEAISSSSISKLGNLHVFLQNWHDICDDPDSIISSFKNMLNGSTENVVKVADEFEKLFSGFITDEQNYNFVSGIGNLLDINHFTSKLLEVKRSKNYRSVNNTSVHRVFEKLNKYD